MLENISHFPVNWIDGMKINKNHFIAMQDNTSDFVRDAIGINTSPISYGLLPTNTNGKNSIKITLGIDNHNLLRVNIDECHAITPNGSRIEINRRETESLNLSIPYPEEKLEMEQGKNMTLLVCISVDNYHRAPFGEIDPQEIPPRYPFTQPEYKLHLIKEDELRSTIGYGNNFLTVGRILVGDNTVLDDNYIPPCTSSESHTKLLEMHTELARFLGQMEIYCVHIAQKENTREYRGDRRSEVASMMLSLTNKITEYLGETVTLFRWTYLYQPPAFMFNTIVSFARIMKNFIDSRAGSGKEELLNYFTEWCDLSQGEFESLCTSLINENYDHMNIDKISKNILIFKTRMETLFSNLYKLDFLDKVVTSHDIFVAEGSGNVSNTVKKSKRHSTFLED